MEKDQEEEPDEIYGALVWVAFLFMTTGAILQFMKTCNTRNIDSICIPSLAIMMISHTLMLTYAYNNNLKSMIGTYSISLGFVATYLFVIYKIKFT